MKPARQLPYAMHTVRLPSGMNDATCRDDGIVQIGNTEVTVTDLVMLVDHLERCEIMKPKKGKRK